MHSCYVPESVVPQSPRISVCLLVYNHARVIRNTLECVLRQDFADFELIVSDDQSTDGTWAIILELAARDPRMRPIRTPRNLGMAANANFCVSHATGPYIALLHHDDIYAPNLLRRWLEVVEKYPDVAFVSNAFAIHDSPRCDFHGFDERTDGTQILEQYLLRRWGCPIRGTAMIRRSCWEQVGGMREQFGMLADVDLWMRLAARWAVGYVNETLVTVRMDRPADYPEGYVGWSWKRVKLLYDIHATNWRDHYGDESIQGKARQLRIRARINGHTVFWLLYGTLRGNRAMVLGSRDLTNPHEFGAVRWLREQLIALATKTAS